MAAAIAEEDYAFNPQAIRDFTKGKPLYVHQLVLKCVKHQIDGVF